MKKQANQPEDGKDIFVTEVYKAGQSDPGFDKKMEGVLSEIFTSKVLEKMNISRDNMAQLSELREPVAVPLRPVRQVFDVSKKGPPPAPPRKVQPKDLSSQTAASSTVIPVPPRPTNPRRHLQRAHRYLANMRCQSGH